MTKRLIYSISIVLLISVLAIGLIAYGRGYRFNPQNKTFSSTGILSAFSSPDAASIWIDGKLTSATNTSITLSPGWYNVRITKDGFQSWEKRVKVQGEVVTRIEALLIRTNPSLRALTSTGLMIPELSPSSTKVAFIVPDDQATYSATLKSKTGVWVFDLRSGPLGGTPDPRQIYQPVKKIDWTGVRLTWSPDEKQIILTIFKNDRKKEVVTSAFQISVENTSISPLDVTHTLSSILAEWETIRKLQNDNLISSLATPAAQLLRNSASHVKFSPDETKILYQATSSATLIPIITPALIGSNPTEEIRHIAPGSYYIYDTKEDKNFFLAEQKEFKDYGNLLWYSDSKHILMIEKDIISIIDYDGTNKRALYSGPFVESIVYPWTNGGKVVILTSLNKPQALLNLYEIDLR